MRLLAIIIVVMLSACQGGDFFSTSSSEADPNSADAESDGEISSYALSSSCEIVGGVDLCSDDGNTLVAKGNNQDNNEDNDEDNDVINILKRYGGSIPAGIEPHTIEHTVNPIKDGIPHIATLGSGTHPISRTMVELVALHPAVNRRQITRPTVSDSFNQTGIHANQHSKTFSQRARSQQRVLDILLVIDSSGSMGDKQAILANQLPTLMNYVSNENWQVGVVNTDPTCRMTGVTSSASRYQKLINVGTIGATEYAVYNAVLAMNGGCGFRNWLRPNSTVAVIILTDEAHQCPINCRPNYLTGHLQSIRPNNYAVYGLVMPGDRSWGNIFNHQGAVNSRSYASVLSRIGSNIQQVLEKTFPLPSTPDSNSLRVTVNGRANSNYTLNGRTVLFDRGYVPPSGSTLVMNWTTGFRPFPYSWNLAKTPLNGTVSAIVTKDGRQLRTLTANQYTLSGRTITLPSDQIEQLMPQGSRLTVTYKESIPLRRDFSFPVPGGVAELRSTINVSVNGQSRTAGTHYDLVGRTVRFRSNHLPPEGASVVIGSFNYRSANKLSYSAPLHQQNPRQETTCSVAGQNIPCTHNGNTLTINGNDFQRGQALKIVQHLQSPSTGSPLHEDFIINSVELTTGGRTCRANEDDSQTELDIEDNTINLNSPLARSRCSAVNNMKAQRNDQYTVTYRYQEFEQDQFVFPDSVYRNNGKSYKVELYIVYVEGLKLDPEEYEIVERRIEFNNRLPSNAKVRAKLWLLPAL